MSRRGGKRDGCPDVVFGQSWEIGEDVGRGRPFRETREHRPQSDAGPLEDWFPPDDVRISNDVFAVIADSDFIGSAGQVLSQCYSRTWMDPSVWLWKRSL